jgi:hypothetical protein
LQEPPLNLIGNGNTEQQSLKQHHAGNSYQMCTAMEIELGA